MTDRRSLHAFMLFLVIVVLYEAAIVSMFGMNHNPSSDEKYFVSAIRSFGQELSVDRLTNYEGVTPPLVFITYSLWGRLFGFDYPALRSLSLLILLCILLTLYWLIEMVSGRTRLALLLPMVFMLNPYAIGLTVYVYTDTLMVLCVVLLCLFVFRNQPVGVFFAAGSGLLTRQYFIFIAIPVLIYYLAGFVRSRDRAQGNLLLAAALSFLPLVGLFFLWKGIGPYDGRKYWPSVRTTVYDLNYLVSYIALIAVYLFPMLFVSLKRLRFERVHFLALIPSAATYFLFPVKASKLGVMVGGMETIGLFHRLLERLLPSPWLIHMVFCICFCSGIIILADSVKQMADHIRSRSVSYILLLDGTIISFLAVMPLSFHIWEKYLLPLIPVLLVRFAAVLASGEQHRKEGERVAFGGVTE